MDLHYMELLPVSVIDALSTNTGKATGESVSPLLVPTVLVR